MCLSLSKTSTLLFFLILVSPVLAFDDDSRDDTRSAIVNTLCKNEQVLNDTTILKSSCQGDIVYLQTRNSVLLKNGHNISQIPVLDFKVSRNGKVYYRTQNGPFLLSETQKLNSLKGAVIIYLVSTQGDVVYLNDQGIVFKNGEPLNQNLGKVTYQLQDSLFPREKIFTAPNLAISRNGQAIYVNDMGQLYIDQESMSPHTSTVKEFKVDSQASVFYLDDLGRLFKNRIKMSQKSSKVQAFKLNARGQVAYLTDGGSKNLFFENQNLKAGSHRILDFSFTGAGEVVYSDDKGRLWKMGQLISD